MTTVAEFAYYPVDFDRLGNIVTQSEVDALKGALAPFPKDPQDIPIPPATDLLVLSHGWNNDKQEAADLYAAILTNARLQIKSGAHPMTGRNIVVFAVHWPSKKIAAAEQIPGGAASLAPDASINADLDALRKLFDGTDGFGSPLNPDVVKVLDSVRELLPNLEQDAQAQDDVGRLLRSIMPPSTNQEEPAIPDTFYSGTGFDALSRLSRPAIDTTPAMGGAAGINIGATAAIGGAAGLGNLFTGVKNGVQNFLNLFTYYEMKDRAGVIGSGAIHRLLVEIQKANGALRIHLAGHSFGGRLVTAALASSDTGTLSVRSVSLLQAAFSHYGFARQYDGVHDGFFRDGVAQPGHLGGSLVITYSKKDRAVGIAYPLASRLRDQIAASLGDANDPYGGMGRNGAQKTPTEVDTAEATLRPAGAKYQELKAGRIYNLEASAFISSHSDVSNENVVHAVLSAMEA